jgi:hypothetical protein
MGLNQELDEIWKSEMEFSELEFRDGLVGNY